MVLLASAITWSASLKRATVTTGPKTSSETIFMSGVVLVSTVGCTKKPGRLTRSPPVTTLAPARRPDSM